MPNIPGIERVRGTRIAGSRHSVPPFMTQPYVTMYMLRKKKERLEKEGIRLDTRRELIVGQLNEIEKDMEGLRRQDKKIQKKRKFDPDTIWVKVKKEADPEEPKKPKGESGWKIGSLKRKG